MNSRPPVRASSTQLVELPPLEELLIQVRPAPTSTTWGFGRSVTFAPIAVVRLVAAARCPRRGSRKSAPSFGPQLTPTVIGVS